MSLCDNPQFQQGKVHTDFIKENKDALFHVQQITPTMAVAAATAFITSQQQSQTQTSSSTLMMISKTKSMDSRWSTLILHDVSLLISSKSHSQRIPHTELRQKR